MMQFVPWMLLPVVHPSAYPRRLLSPMLFTNCPSRVDSWLIILRTLVSFPAYLPWQPLIRHPVLFSTRALCLKLQSSSFLLMNTSIGILRNQSSFSFPVRSVATLYVLCVINLCCTYTIPVPYRIFLLAK
ncbi:hypothetical protein B0J11DRAFT_242361 [Dendryphion nanum]|uniref:Uncharacterized protein n=1 Tax=Dendryphion nanum TaxID=256645 RepID=A0A9P9I6U9_9PLEO|nr:hypothetical protein B0J11DRAFT_242361 [Dendryphion nanum]